MTAFANKLSLNTLRKWFGGAHTPHTIVAIVVLMLVAVAIIPNRQMPTSQSAPTAVRQHVGLGASDSAAIGNAVGEKVEPFLTRHTEAINALKSVYQELKGRLGTAEGRLDAHDVSIKGLQGDIKALDEQKFDKKDFDKAIEPYLKKIPELMSQIDRLEGQVAAAQKEAATATANFLKRATV